MLNVVVLMGRLTADPELRTTASGLSYCRFTVAVDRVFSKNTEEKKTDFISCVAWRQTAEFIARYFTKGQMVAIEGSIQTGSYVNKDNVKVYTTDVVVNNASFTGSKKESGGSYSGSAYQGGAYSAPTPAPAPVAQKAPINQTPDPSVYSNGNTNDFAEIPIDEDLPF
ncbi:MAG: single-stranded DNA-binding protein [Clostridia bacterium]|nr:single-stranded DNA-binding protein [Clostridia bacterium]